MTTRTDEELATLNDIASRLRDDDQWLVATHINPDGDAIGCARSVELIGQALGKDVIVYVPGAVVPPEYRFIAPERLVDAPPADTASRTLVCVDCGNESRLANDDLIGMADFTVNIDHHADNTAYGDLNAIDGSAPCATMLVRDLAALLDVDVSGELATALYVGLVTDTGRFQYSNTTERAFMLAAELVTCGVDVHDVFKRIFEQQPWNRVSLLGRALEKAQTINNGQIIATHLTRSDFADCEADDDAAEGVVEVLRGVDGAVAALFVRDLADGAPFARKGSLRTTSNDVDVSIIARSWAGGGHRQAAGFSTDDDMDAIIERVRLAVDEQLNG